MSFRTAEIGRSVLQSMIRDAHLETPDAEQQRARDAGSHQSPIAFLHLVEQRQSLLAASAEEALRCLDGFEEKRRQYEECAHSDRNDDVAQRELFLVLKPICVLVDRCWREIAASLGWRFPPSRFARWHHDDHKEDVQE
jgi:hypothetical protein